MSVFDTTDIQRFAVSVIGALILSTACIVAAVGPAQAAQSPAPIASSDHAALPTAFRACPRTLEMQL